MKRPRMGEICSCFLVPVKRRAAEFCTSWSLFIWSSIEAQIRESYSESTFEVINACIKILYCVNDTYFLILAIAQMEEGRFADCFHLSGAPNEDKVQNQWNIVLLNVF